MSLVQIIHGWPALIETRMAALYQCLGPNACSRNLLSLETREVEVKNPAEALCLLCNYTCASSHSALVMPSGDQL